MASKNEQLRKLIELNLLSIEQPTDVEVQGQVFVDVVDSTLLETRQKYSTGFSGVKYDFESFQFNFDSDGVGDFYNLSTAEFAVVTNWHVVYDNTSSNAGEAFFRLDIGSMGVLGYSAENPRIIQPETSGKAELDRGSGPIPISEFTASGSTLAARVSEAGFNEPNGGTSMSLKIRLGYVYGPEEEVINFLV
jgi:hypothetical protein